MTDGTGSDVIAHFKAGFETLRRYPTLALPPLAVQVALLVVMLLIWGGATGMGVLMGGMMGGGAGAVVGGGAGFVVGALLFMLLTGLSSLVASGVVIVMARDAVAGRDPGMGDAVGAVLGRLLDVVLASVMVAVVVTVGMFFFVLPGLVAAFFLVFTLPAVLLDGQGAVAALKRSATAVAANLGSVAVLFVGGVIVFAATAVLAGILGWVPLLGHLARAALFGVSIAYMSVVCVRTYQALPRP